MVMLGASAPGAWAASLFIVSGGGNGHGVGMSQYGAYGYALHGYNYRQILAHYYQGTTLQTLNPNRVVRVLLQTGSASFDGANLAGTRKLNPAHTYRVQARADGSIALFGPSGKQLAVSAAPLTVSGPGPLNVAGRGTYRGSLEFRPDGAGGVETIDAIGLDDYVRGVVASEMPASWSAQALDAQAVAARTYALTSDVGGSQYQLYSDTRSQAYGGVAAETPTSDAAVAATSGQIVTYNGAPAITYFFSSSGGYTENVENVFGSSPEPWLKGVPDPYDGAGGDPYHSWTYTMSPTAAAGKLSGLVRGSLIGIQVTRHGASPRILTAVVVGTGGRVTTTGSDLEQRFGLLSTLASFTTITTNSGHGPRAALAAAIAQNPDLSQIGAVAATSVSALVHQLFASSGPVVYGSVFPAPAGATLLVQRLNHGRWGTVARTQAGARGGYSFAVSAAGAYRVVFGSLAGPTVTVG